MCNGFNAVRNCTYKIGLKKLICNEFWRTPIKRQRAGQDFVLVVCECKCSWSLWSRYQEFESLQNYFTMDITTEILHKIYRIYHVYSVSHKIYSVSHIIYGGGVFVGCNFFTSAKNFLVLAVNFKQSFFSVSLKNGKIRLCCTPSLLYGHPGHHIFQHFRQQTCFFCPYFQQQTFLSYFFRPLPLPPPQIQMCVP